MKYPVLYEVVNSTADANAALVNIITRIETAVGYTLDVNEVALVKIATVIEDFFVCDHLLKNAMFM